MSQLQSSQTETRQEETRSVSPENSAPTHLHKLWDRLSISLLSSLSPLFLSPPSSLPSFRQLVGQEIQESLRKRDIQIGMYQARLSVPSISGKRNVFVMLVVVSLVTELSRRGVCMTAWHQIKDQATCEDRSSSHQDEALIYGERKGIELFSTEY